MKTKITILIYLMILLSIKVKAQYVTIPDARFAHQLNLIIPSAMIGNQMDTSNIAVTSLTSLTITFDTICNIDGIQFFDSLQSLDCSFNHLDTLLNLPNSLQALYCSNNWLIYLPAIPSGLTIFDCSQNLLDSLPALPINLIQFDCHNNQLISLPSLPSTITQFNCTGNQLTSLPTLPPNLTNLICYENQLDSLPLLPSTITSIECEYNHLTSLPTLPIALTFLDCSVNYLTSLPTLPITLTDLECFNNQLNTLPTLPSSLEILVCSQNPMPALPTLPSSLITLKCYMDSLTFLPSLPGSLDYLDCRINFISSLPTLPSSLTYLDCSMNTLTSLPALSSSLVHLNCSDNPISTLPTLTSSLQNLYCSSNLFTTLPTLPSSLNILVCANDPLIDLPTLPGALYSLDCHGSTLDSLPSLPSSLSFLDCSYNSLVSLPALSNLSDINCYYNLLTSLPAIPPSLQRLYCSNNQINCFDVFPFTITEINLYNNPYTCLPNYIPAMDSITLLKPLCVTGDFVNNPYNCTGAQGIVGFTYTDIDSSCSKDSTDVNLRNIPMRILDNMGALIGQTYTASNGVYDFPQPAGTYTIVVDTAGLPIIPQCATPGIDSTVSVSLTTPLSTDINFDFNCKPGFDVGVKYVCHEGAVFPGETHTIKMWAGDMSEWYHLNCATGISGQVQVTVVGPVTFSGVTPGALIPTIAGSTYTYSIADFGTILNSTAFGLNFTTLTTAGSGSPIYVSIDVTPIGGDNDTTNNHYDFSYEVVNSHDPNYKETTHEVFTPDLDDYFTYSIHFQNTGSAPAINIHVDDTLSTDLDLSTFQFLSSSHESTVILNGNSLRVRFANIMLADSLSSPDSSQGYFQYRIKRKPSLPLPILIHNTAYIYFDYNTPVITNTTSNVCRPGVVAGIDQNELEQNLSLYPNPSSNEITINYTSSFKTYSIKIYDAQGKLVRQLKNIISGENHMDISTLKNGLYLLNLQEGNNSITKRFIKE